MSGGEVLLALDLSLAGLGMVAGPLSWDRDWRRLRSKTLGVTLKADAPSREHTSRLIGLARDVAKYAHWVRATHVVAEDLPRGRAFGVIQLAELRGLVRARLWLELCLEIEFVPMGSARKLLYGRTPPSKLPSGRKLTDTQRKAWLTEPVIAAGARFDDHNQVDAFCCFNFAAAELGAPSFARLVGDPESKPKRARRKAAA